MKSLLLAASSLLAVALPAASAAAADNGVARGHVLEFARYTTISGSAGNDGATFMKVFATQHRSHVIVENGTGQLKYETVTSPRVVKTYVASEDTLYLRDGTTSPYEQTPYEEARYFQEGVADGCFVKTGTTGNLDRYKMVDQPQLPCSDSPDTKVDVLVDQHFGFVVSRVTTNGDFRQETSLAYTKDHTEPGRRALLRLAPHPGARVVDERS